jgi:hypothetical protein
MKAKARSFRLPDLQPDQRDLEIMRRAQLVHRPHDLAIGHGTVGAQEDASLLPPVAVSSAPLVSMNDTSTISFNAENCVGKNLEGTVLNYTKSNLGGCCIKAMVSGLRPNIFSSGDSNKLKNSSKTLQATNVDAIDVTVTRPAFASSGTS